MAALFKLRRSEPKLIRPFRAPLYPWAPAFALAMAVLCLVAMVWYNPLLALIFAAMMLGGYLWFRKTAAARRRAPVDHSCARSPEATCIKQLSGQVWRFDSLKTLMAKASPARSATRWRALSPAAPKSGWRRKSLRRIPLTDILDNR
jgi:uncharacterized membrane protein